MEVSSIRLRIVGVEELSVIIRSSRDKLCESQVSLYDQAGLDPLVGPDLLVKFNGLEVPYAGVVIVIAISF